MDEPRGEPRALLPSTPGCAVFERMTQQKVLGADILRRQILRPPPSMFRPVQPRCFWKKLTSRYFPEFEGDQRASRRSP